MKPSAIVKLFVLPFLFLLTAPFDHPSSAEAASDFIYTIELDDATISPATAEFISSAIKKAEINQAQCLIIKLDTPGGLLTSTRTIVKDILSSKVPIIVYVAPPGARAGSAGVFITYASHIAAMAPSTNIGAAHPVGIGKQDDQNDKKELWRAVRKLTEQFSKGEKGKEEPKEMEGQQEEAEEIESGSGNPLADKIMNDTLAFIRAMAKERGRNVEWAVKSVRESASITAEEAVANGVVEFLAANERELLVKLNGQRVQIQGEEHVIHTENATVQELPMNFRMKILNVLANPNIAYILMMLGFYGLLFEVTHPGFGVPGILGSIFLILAFFSLQMLPTNFAGLALIGFGILLFVSEVFVPGFGLLTFGGIVSLVLGSLFLFDTEVEFMRVSIAIIAPFVLATAGITVFLINAVVQAHRRKGAAGKEGMIGEMGKARTDFSGGEGKVFVHGEIWDARSSQEIKKGDSVSVLKVEGLCLTVEKKDK